MATLLNSNTNNQYFEQALTTLKQFALLTGIAFFSSCFQKEASLKKEVTLQLHVIDSLLIAGRSDSVLTLLPALNNKYQNNVTPFMALYYCEMAERARDTEAIMNTWADSALAAFNNETLAKLYPEKYFKALLIKGQACIANKKYNMALKYFYRAKELENINECEESELFSRLAGIFYNQQNYRVAASYWYTSFTMGNACDAELQRKKFSMQQGALDNAGLAYDRAGLADSAAYCFFKDTALIEAAAKNNVDSNIIKAATIVVFDNLGGLYIKWNKLDSAEYYLAKSTAVKWTDYDGITIPPLLKLANLYTKTGNFAKAEDAFARSRLLLNRYPKYNPDSQVKWHKLYAAFLVKNNRQLDAYSHLAEYIRLKDSIDKGAAALMALNVGKEFSTLQQQQTLNELKIKDKVNKVYLWAITMVVALSFIIIVLVYRNLKKSRKSYTDTIWHNQKLQRALDELENVNKNYIRIMRVMAHDLRNPLGGITGIAGILLKDDGLNAEQRHMLVLVESTGNHSMEMINELFNSSLAQEDEHIATGPHDIAALLYNTVELLQFKAKEKNQTLAFTGSRAPVTANINHEKMWRVFNNIIVNAIKFTPQGGTIQASISRQGNRGVITITDNGIGIPDSDKAHVFDMFTPAKKPGTNGEKPFGLGLSISKRIIEKHNAKMWFESVEHKGTTFYIELAVIE